MVVDVVIVAAAEVLALCDGGDNSDGVANKPAPQPPPLPAESAAVTTTSDALMVCGGERNTTGLLANSARDARATFSAGVGGGLARSD